jgi:SAM-dependent methyltransferase
MGSRGVGKLNRDSEARIRELWSDQAGKWSGQGLHWLEHPAVQDRIQSLTGGADGRDRFQYFIHKYCPAGTPVDCVLTLGCGDGEFERGLAQYGFAREHDAFDIAEGAIQKAVDAARKAGLTHIRYEVADLNRVALKRDRYDVVFGLSAIHHISALEYLFAQVRASLKPGGFFLLDEFIGPSQFQWPDAQLQAANQAPAGLPERFRRQLNRPGQVKTAVSRPTIEAMNAGDPSEAIRSAEIVPLLQDYFEVIEFRGYGGSLLHLVMEGIAGNFVPDDPLATECVERLCALEDRLILEGRLAHDFAVIIARKVDEGPR